jgi:hypothetical protein
MPNPTPHHAITRRNGIAMKMVIKSWLMCPKLISLLLLLIPASSFAQTSSEELSFTDLMKADFRYHYSARPLTEVAVGFGVTGLLANSSADENIQQLFRDKLQGDAGDSLADLFTTVGDVSHPLYSIPIYLGTMWIGGYSGEAESAAARWGANSLRGLLIGTPELLVLQNVAGGQRPEDGEPGWTPFDGDAGVSGHAFSGAVPIITAARMTDKRWLKYTLYVTSTLPGLARVYDDQHYFSQTFMGWWLAYVAAKTVEHTNFGDKSTAHIMPLLYPDGGGLQVSIQF